MRQQLRFLLVIVAQCALPAAHAAELVVTPYRPTGIYDRGETVGWTIVSPNGPSEPIAYSVKQNNFTEIKAGQLDLSSGEAKLELTLDEPAMLYVELRPPGNEKPLVVAAAVAPTELKPVAPRPADFDAFWKSKLELLAQVPPNPVLTSGDSGRSDVDYATIKMDTIDSEHVHGQFAKPKRAGKFPALVIFQWASPPYPLDKSWVVGRAAEGWLALNIEPHNVLPTEPQAYYDALPEVVKKYEAVGNDDRDRSHFLKMYLRDYRAVDYLVNHPDWDGKTLVAMGTSMGGQQSLCVAALHPRVTHVITNVAAGCDTNGPLHGRQSSYPNFPSDDPKVMETALYFDVVNFAPKIKAKTLMAIGFEDTVSAPAGLWTAFNLIPGEKEAIPLVNSPHNHLATPAEQRPYSDRSAQWLFALARGAEPTPRSLAEVPVDDHPAMMAQLGIKSLRPGANPQRQEDFSEAEANRYADTLPDVLTMNDGTKVTRPDQWPARRAEILDDFAREVLGRIPDNVPGVTWEVTATTPGNSGGIPTVTKTLVGHVDNSAYPRIKVDIQASFTVPAETTTPVPIMIAFAPRWNGEFGRGPWAGQRAGVPWTEQAIAHGWGFGYIDPTSIQADSTDQLRAGIIGLTNHGQLRKPDEWGALRAWQWGVSRLIDYFETHTDSHVDATKVGIEGLSRYGKAALVTQAYDDRVAVGLIGSSGAGGTKLYRHIFGEMLENLAGGAYHWMAGNLLKYAAEGAAADPLTVADLPVDSHELIAACAPRPCFISHGVVEKGDAHWIDVRGSFMAGVLAGRVYRLLGKRDFGTPGDYLTDPMPPVLTLIGGDLAWRQHDGGHDVTPNWPAFFAWVGNYVDAPRSAEPTALAAGSPSAAPTAALPAAPSSERADPAAVGSRGVPRGDQNSKIAHAELLNKAKQGGIDLYFLGDSITRRWGCTDPQWASLMANWKENFFGWNAGNFGWGGDSAKNVLWRIENGELDGVNPQVIVLLAGTNDVGNQPGDDAQVAAKVDQVAEDIKAILDTCREKAPTATIILTAIFPRNDNPAVMPTINQINQRIAEFADGKQIRFLNVNDKLADKSGKLFDGMMGDGLHPAVKGYQVWADGLKPLLTELLGPPAKEDHAPPPTGDPSIATP